MEIWKDVPDYEGLYQVSNLGRVKTVRTNRITVGSSIRGQGYKQVGLFKNGKRRMESVHRLVAIVFVPNPNNYPCVNHIDHDRENNSSSNLEWCTVKYNNSNRSNCLK